MNFENPRISLTRNPKPRTLHLGPSKPQALSLEFDTVFPEPERLNELLSLETS